MPGPQVTPVLGGERVERRQRPPVAIEQLLRRHRSQRSGDRPRADRVPEYRADARVRHPLSPGAGTYDDRKPIARARMKDPPGLGQPTRETPKLNTCWRWAENSHALTGTS